MQSPVLERLVGGAVLVALLLLLALVIGPREGARMPDEGVAEVPRAQDAPEFLEGEASAFPADGGSDGERVSALEWDGERPDPDADPPEPAAGGPEQAGARTPPDPSAAAAVPAAPAGRWAVQVGSFSARARADRLSDWCRERGYGVRVLALPDNGRTLYRVRVGPYASRNEARSAVAELALLGRSGFVSDWPEASP